MDAERGAEQGVFRAFTHTSPSNFRQPPTMSSSSRVGDWELDCEICQRHEIRPVRNPNYLYEMH